MRVLLADDDGQVCSALRLLLEQVPGVVVVGEARDAESLALEMMAAAPDAVLLDWELPGLSPGPHLAALKADGNPRLVVLSSRPEAQKAALKAGADAFVSKGDPPETLLAALGAARGGGKQCTVNGITLPSSENRD
ncbi:MAG: response regulator [Anaerolineae bacterium]